LGIKIDKQERADNDQRAPGKFSQHWFLTPGSLLQVAQLSAHFFALMRPDLLSFSFSAARHIVPPSK
jgi:hypothetical protein